MPEIWKYMKPLRGKGLTCHLSRLLEEGEPPPPEEGASEGEPPPPEEGASEGEPPPPEEGASEGEPPPPEEGA